MILINLVIAVLIDSFNANEIKQEK